MFVDATNRAIFVSPDDCHTFAKYLLPFVPSSVDFHPTLEVMKVRDGNSGIVSDSPSVFVIILDKCRLVTCT